MAAPEGSGRRRGGPAWPGLALRASFVLICVINAVLDWLPGFRSGYPERAHRRGAAPAGLPAQDGSPGPAGPSVLRGNTLLGYGSL
jgi:hypothetical protein